MAATAAPTSSSTLKKRSASSTDSTGHVGMPRRSSSARQILGPSPAMTTAPLSSTVVSNARKILGGATSKTFEASHTISQAMSVNTAGTRTPRTATVRIPRTVTVVPQVVRIRRECATKIRSAGSKGATPRDAPLIVTGARLDNSHTDPM